MILRFRFCDEEALESLHTQDLLHRHRTIVSDTNPAKLALRQILDMIDDEPMLLSMMDADRIKGLPIYLVHGAWDWMFPIDIARTANEALMAAGAAVTYREVADLSHTYPREENAKIMHWFLG